MKEKLKGKRSKEVYETLTNQELHLIWYIRHMRTGDWYRFHKIAEKYYEVLQEIKTLAKPSD